MVLTDDGKLLDKKRLATYLGVCERTIRRWRKEDKLPTPLIVDGKHRDYWSVAQIDRWQLNGILHTVTGQHSDNAN